VREYPYAAEEERTRSDEEREAHSPQMTRDPLLAGKTSPNHAHVARSAQEGDRRKKEASHRWRVDIASSDILEG
jgi:hypothetical protein